MRNVFKQCNSENELLDQDKQMFGYWGQNFYDILFV